MVLGGSHPVDCCCILLLVDKYDLIRCLQLSICFKMTQERVLLCVSVYYTCVCQCVCVSMWDLLVVEIFKR